MPITKFKVPDHVQEMRRLLDDVESFHLDKVHTRVLELGVQLQRAAKKLFEHGAWIQLHAAFSENREGLARQRAMESQKDESVH